MNTGAISTTISVCAFGLTLFQAYTTRRHNRLSVTPHITGQANMHFTPEGVTYWYDISNNGIGPAKIKKFEIFWNGNLRSNELGDCIPRLMEELFKDRLKYDYKSCFTYRGEGSMRAGDSRTIAKVFFPGLKNSDQMSVYKILNETRLLVEYASFYGDRFVFDSDEYKLNIVCQ